MTRSIGIDIGAFSLKIAEIEASGKSRKILGLYEIPRREGEEVGKVLHDFLKDSGIVADRLAVGLGTLPVYTKKMEFPFSDRKRLMPAVIGELEDSLPFEITNHILDIKTLSKRGRINRFIVGLCPESAVEFLNKLCEEANILPFAFFVDVEALGQLALNQCLAASEAGVSYAVIDLGYSSTKVAILKGSRPESFESKTKSVGEVGEIVEMRTINHGSSELLDWIKNRKRLSEEDARQWLIHRAEIKVESQDGSMSQDMSDEVKVALRPIVVELYQTFQHYKGKSGETVNTIYLTGAMSGLRGLREFISEELRILTDMWPIGTGFTTDSIAFTPESERSFATAIALAHRFCVRKPLGWLNFRRSPQAHKKLITSAFQHITREQFRPLLLGFVATLAFVFVYASVSKFLLAKESESLKTQLVDEFRRLDRDVSKRVEKFADDPDRVAELFETEKKKHAPLMASEKQGLSEHARSDVLLDVSGGVPSDAVLREIKMDKASHDSTFESILQTASPLPSTEIDPLKKKLETYFKSRGYSNVQLEPAFRGSADLKVRALWKGQNP